MAGFIIGTIVILILAIRLIQVMRSYDDTCIQVQLCAENKMICARKNTCSAYKRFTPAVSSPHASGGDRSVVKNPETQGGKP